MSEADFERIEFWCSKAAGRAIYGPVLERVRERAETAEAALAIAEVIIKSAREFPEFFTADGSVHSFARSRDNPERRCRHNSKVNSMLPGPNFGSRSRSSKN